MSKLKRDAHGEIAKSVEIGVSDDFVHIHVTTLPIEVAREGFSKMLDHLAIKADGRPT